LNVGGMLIAFLALIAMLNGILGWVHTLPLMGWLPGSLEQILESSFRQLLDHGRAVERLPHHWKPAGHPPGDE